MTFVEQYHPGFQWAEPTTKGKNLEVRELGDDLEVTGLFPRYEEEERAYDLMQQYEIDRKNRSASKQRSGKEAPHIQFANADTDEKLVAFTRKFGPVVAKSVMDFRMIPDPELREPRWPAKFIAVEDLQELRNEQRIYRAALGLVAEISSSDFDREIAKALVTDIAAYIKYWPRQWRRERRESHLEPFWRPSFASIKRVISFTHPFWPLDPVGARIVMSEVLNVFRAKIFPNSRELHDAIRYGIRPLLYSILRREYLYPREFGVCANTQCKEFFDIERAGQAYCRPECSIRQRQRDYWKTRGKKLRTDKTESNGKRRKGIASD